MATHIIDQLCMWALLCMLVAIVIWGEGRSLHSLGLNTLSWRSAGWSLVATACIFTANAIIVPLLTRIGLIDFSNGLAVVVAWPLWLRIFAVITAGVVEEVFYRGYAIERLASLTGSYWFAGVISVVIFGLVHLPFWGVGILFNTLFAGSVFTVLYIWRRDLWPCIIAHSLLDAIAFIILPVFGTAP